MLSILSCIQTTAFAVLDIRVPWQLEPPSSFEVSHGETWLNKVQETFDAGLFVDGRISFEKTWKYIFHCETFQ